ncbi:hypothetical protein CPB85DRAFT_1309563 [Mucidula mucida]|nr:hypothetical protein CPB85DRAFT_1309563 [Mucidula mucida]
MPIYHLGGFTTLLHGPCYDACTDEVLRDTDRKGTLRGRIPCLRARELEDEKPDILTLYRIHPRWIHATPNVFIRTAHLNNLSCRQTPVSQRIMFSEYLIPCLHRCPWLANLAATTWTLRRRVHSWGSTRSPIEAFKTNTSTILSMIGSPKSENIVLAGTIRHPAKGSAVVDGMLLVTQQVWYGKITKKRAASLPPPLERDIDVEVKQWLISAGVTEDKLEWLSIWETYTVGLTRYGLRPTRNDVQGQRPGMTMDTTKLPDEAEPMVLDWIKQGRPDARTFFGDELYELMTADYSSS